MYAFPAKTMMPILSFCSLSTSFEIACLALIRRLGLMSSASMLLDTSRATIKSTPLRCTFSNLEPICGFANPIINEAKANIRTTNLKTALLFDTLGSNRLITELSPNLLRALFFHLSIKKKTITNTGISDNP